MNHDLLLSAPIKSFVFVAVGGATTAKGWYVNANGAGVGFATSVAINAASGTPKVLTSAAGAVGGFVTFAADVYVGLADIDSTTNTVALLITDMTTNYANYPTLPAGTYNIGQIFGAQV